MVEERPARIGQPNRLGRAFEQGKSNFVFQIADLSAKRRLRDMQLQRCARDVFHLGHRHEIAQVPQFHGPLRVCPLIMMRQET